MHSAVIPSILSHPALLLAEQLVHQRYVHPGPLVLRTNPFKYLTPTADRDRTVSRRSKPSSRTTLIGEQPNPWDLLQPQDVMSRHRGAKLRRRCELLGGISLLSQASLCHCTRRLISNQSELTFARLRYSLGGDRPSQTTHHAGSLYRITVRG